MSYLSSKNRILIFALIAGLALFSRLGASAEKPSPKTFASPSEAGAALLAAAESGDRSALLEIFGPDGAEILFIQDPERDRVNRLNFISAYKQMNRWGKIKAGGQTLYVGAANYAFPIPLGQNTAGRWFFDTAAGKDELLARRIGRAELTAIAACEAIANAQEEYVNQPRDSAKAGQYADKFVSDPGKQNGLYWPVNSGQAPSPLGQLGDLTNAVASNAGDQPVLFNGYYYRILGPAGDPASEKQTREFTILAYPAEYRSSGIMAFAVGSDGAVYQKDLGEKTKDIALIVTKFKPAEDWSPVTPRSGTASRTKQ
jgi:hypothetical protein